MFKEDLKRINLSGQTEVRDLSVHLQKNQIISVIIHQLMSVLSISQSKQIQEKYAITMIHIWIE